MYPFAFGMLDCLAEVLEGHCSGFSGHSSAGCCVSVCALSIPPVDPFWVRVLFRLEGEVAGLFDGIINIIFQAGCKVA